MRLNDDQLGAALSQAAQGSRPQPFRPAMPAKEDTLKRTAAGLAKKTSKDDTNE